MKEKNCMEHVCEKEIQKCILRSPTKFVTTEKPLLTKHYFFKFHHFSSNEKKDADQDRLFKLNHF